MVGVKLLSCLPCGLIADCGAITGDLRAYRGLSFVLVLLSGERGLNRFKMKQGEDLLFNIMLRGFTRFLSK